MGLVRVRFHLGNQLVPFRPHRGDVDLVHFIKVGSVKARCEQGFLGGAFDPWSATLQIGGSDQWGNMLSGAQMIKKLDGGEAHVWTVPLILDKSTGKKFGKSEGNAIWLDDQMTSPYKFYQFWLNVGDESVGDYLRIFTHITPDDHAQLMTDLQANPGQRDAQKYLAYEVTKLVHGVDRAEASRNVTAALFGDTPFSELLETELDMLAGEIPTTASSHVINALVTSGVAVSNSEAKRLIEGGAISVNGEKISEDIQLVTPALIKKGKNSFILAR